MSQLLTANRPCYFLEFVVVLEGQRGALRETPPGLAIKTAFAETEYDRGNDSIQQNVATPNRVAEPCPGALRSGEMGAIFRFKSVSDGSAFCRVSHSHRVALDDKVETVEIIAARCQHAARILSKILRLALVGTSAEIRRTVGPDAEQGSDVRASIWTNGRQPVELGVLKFPTAPFLRGRNRIWTAEWTQLGHWRTFAHVISISVITNRKVRRQSLTVIGSDPASLPIVPGPDRENAARARCTGSGWASRPVV